MKAETQAPITWDTALYERLFIGFAARNVAARWLPEILCQVNEDWFLHRHRRLVYEALCGLHTRNRARGAFFTAKALAGASEALCGDPTGWAAEEIQDCMAAESETFITEASLKATLIPAWHVAKGRPAVRRELMLADELLGLTAMQGTQTLEDVSNHLRAACEQWDKAMHGLPDENRVTAHTVVAELLTPIDDSKPDHCSTGISDLDGMLGGGIAMDNAVVHGRLITVAGRPGMGKTAFLCSLAHNVSQGGGGVLLYSLEVDAKQIYTRLLGIHDFTNQLITKGRIVEALTLKSLRNRSFTEAQRERLRGYAKDLSQNLVIYDQSVSLDQICNQVRLQKRRDDNVRLVCIDYLGLMELPDAETQTLAIGRATRALKLLAVELKIDIVLLSQLNRGVEGRTNKTPQLSDLRDSGRIEEDSDAVIGLFRPEYYDPTTQPNQIELHMLKNRHGITGKLTLGFDGKTGVVYGELPVKQPVANEEAW